MSHQRMADVQFVDALDRGDCFDVVIMQAVTGVDDQALGETKRYAVGYPLQFFGDFSRGLSIGIATGMQFNGRCTDAL